MPEYNGSWKTMTGWAGLEGRWLRRKHFTPQALERIAEQIRRAETDHAGELVLVVEAASPKHEPDSHMRALEIFGRMRVWDTPGRTGLLLYLALDKHRIEIIADRGIDANIQAWDGVCRQLQARLRGGDFVPGVLEAIAEIENILRAHCPAIEAGRTNENDLPDAPVLI